MEANSSDAAVSKHPSSSHRMDNTTYKSTSLLSPTNTTLVDSESAFSFISLNSPIHASDPYILPMTPLRLSVDTTMILDPFMMSELKGSSAKKPELNV
ncbi:hypothetical protein O181_036106 [Austropuccinia psidii MF-1]|uniref:Uncharacterized protein n=1 Tax=Austropuccinia psidii MF-1 TaxID=1389203 RepID=A0A9Q3H9L7_9BASI|nr:hypothetical protein [Austropuccinia psidii MF-1]